MNDTMMADATIKNGENMTFIERIKKMHDDNMLKFAHQPTTERIKKSEKEIEQFILNSKVHEMFDFLHFRMNETGKPQKICIMWANIMYTVTCEPVTDFEKQRKAFLQSEV